MLGPNWLGTLLYVYTQTIESVHLIGFLVVSDASSALFEAHSPVSSFSDPPNEPASNLCDMDMYVHSLAFLAALIDNSL